MTYGGSFAWGAFAGSSLLIGALIAIWFGISLRWIGLIMAFGSGVLISAVAFDLIQESFELAGGGGSLVLGLFLGCLVFFVGDQWIGHMGGSDRKSPTGPEAAANNPTVAAEHSGSTVVAEHKTSTDAEGSGNGLGIVLGAVLDGVPESMVIGLTLIQQPPAPPGRDHPDPGWADHQVEAVQPPR